MRKTCAIMMTLFYLSLTTGIYTCLLHCTADFIQQHTYSQDSHFTAKEHVEDEDDEDESCRKGDCNCCYHHGTYVVKENLHPVGSFSFPAAHIAVITFNWERFFNVRETFTPLISWPRSTGPPFLSTQPIYISNRTLLI